MKKILFLTPTLPFPPVSGGVIKSFKVVQYLSAHYQTDIACLLKNDDPEHVTAFLKIVHPNVFINEICNIPRTAKNLLLSNLQNIPLNLYRNKSGKFKQKVEAVIHQYDVVFCDHYVMFQYIPKQYKGKIILHQHNCEYLIWKRFASLEKNLIKKIALLNQAYHIKKYEKQICNRATVVLAAPNDTLELEKIGVNTAKFIETYHLGDDHLLALPDLVFNTSQPALLYIGTLSWEANIDGLVWFYDEIWHLVKQQQPNIKLYIIGKNPDNRIKAIATADPDIILTGFIDDVEPYFQQSRIFITPLRFGSGIKVKVVNALYRGIPCVTTSVGAEGLKVIDGKHLFIKDNPQAYAAAINTLMQDETLWNTLRNNARKLAKENYTWEYVLANISKAIDE